jgi:hypothetical protein
MKRKQSLAEQFAAIQAERDRIEREYLKLKSAYFADRRIRAKRGEQLEDLILSDSAEWSTQLGREQIARSNGESDREARRDPHTRSLFGENAAA